MLQYHPWHIAMPSGGGVHSIVERAEKRETRAAIVGTCGFVKGIGGAKARRFVGVASADVSDVAGDG